MEKTKVYVGNVFTLKQDLEGVSVKTNEKIIFKAGEQVIVGFDGKFHKVDSLGVSLFVPEAEVSIEKWGMENLSTLFLNELSSKLNIEKSENGKLENGKVSLIDLMTFLPIFFRVLGMNDIEDGIHIEVEETDENNVDVETAETESEVDD